MRAKAKPRRRYQRSLFAVLGEIRACPRDRHMFRRLAFKAALGVAQWRHLNWLARRLFNLHPRDPDAAYVRGFVDALNTVRVNPGNPGTPLSRPLIDSERLRAFRAEEGALGTTQVCAALRKALDVR